MIALILIYILSSTLVSNCIDMVTWLTMDASTLMQSNVYLNYEVSIFVYHVKNHPIHVICGLML